MPAERFSTFFFVANLWFLVSLILLIAKNKERYDPDRYSFFGLPSWHTPTAYNSFVAIALVCGSTCMVLAYI